MDGARGHHDDDPAAQVTDLQRRRDRNRGHPPPPHDSFETLDFVSHVTAGAPPPEIAAASQSPSVRRDASIAQNPEPAAGQPAAAHAQPRPLARPPADRLTIDAMPQRRDRRPPASAAPRFVYEPARRHHATRPSRHAAAILASLSAASVAIAVIVLSDSGARTRQPRQTSNTGTPIAATAADRAIDHALSDLILTTAQAKPHTTRHQKAPLPRPPTARRRPSPQTAPATVTASTRAAASSSTPVDTIVRTAPTTTARAVHDTTVAAVSHPSASEPRATQPTSSPQTTTTQSPPPSTPAASVGTGPPCYPGQLGCN